MPPQRCGAPIDGGMPRRPADGCVHGHCRCSLASAACDLSAGLPIVAAWRVGTRGLLACRLHA